MTNIGFATLPPDPDYVDGPPCHYCGSVLLEDGDCAFCEPRCLLEDTPLRCWGFVIDATGGVHELTGVA